MAYGQLLATKYTKALYRFNSGALTTDSSGNGHTLTAIGTPGETLGKFDGAVDLGGAEVGTDQVLGDNSIDWTFKTNYWYAQAFTPTKANLLSVGVQLYKDNSPTGNLTIEIQTDNAGVPSGTVLATATLNVATLTTSSAAYKIAVPIALTVGTKYHCVLKGLAAWDDTNNVIWGAKPGSGYAQYNYGPGNFSLNGTDYQFSLTTYYGYSLPSSAYSATDHADFKPTGNFTIAYLIKSANLVANACIFQSYSQNTNMAGIRARVDSDGNNATFLIGKNTGITNSVDYRQITTTDITLDDGTGHFVVCPYDGNNLRIFVDGVQKAISGAWTSYPAYAATNYVRIGCGNRSGANEVFVAGALDELILEEGAWSAQYIRNLWNQMKGRYAPKMI